MKKCFLLIAGSVWWLAGFTQSPQGKELFSLTGYSKNFTDVFSFTANPASLALLGEQAVGIYSEKKYLIKELDDYLFAWARPLGKAAIGFSGSYQGDGFYRRSHYLFSLGRKLSPKADLGMQLGYGQLKVDGYGHSAFVSAGIGAILHLTEKLHTGIFIANPLVTGKRTDQTPSFYTLGVGYEASGKVLVSIQLGQEENGPAQINTGLQYNISKQVFMRVIIASATGTMVLATGLKWRNIRTDISASYHPQLGLTPALLLIITKSERKDYE